MAATSPRHAGSTATRLLDGKANPTGYLYDSVGNLTHLIHALGDRLAFSYDADGNLTRRIDGNQQTTTYTRAPDDSRLTDIGYSDSTQNVHYDYDAYGRVRHVADSTGTTDYTYDDLDNILTVTTTYTGLPVGQRTHTLTYSYYPDGSRSSMVLSTFNPGTPPTATTYTFTYQYFNDGRMKRAGDAWTNGYVEYDYMANGWLKHQYQFLATTSYTYNARGFLRSLRNYDTSNLTPFSNFTNIRHDTLGNRTQYDVYVPEVGSTPEITGRITRIYDAQDRLVEEISTFPASYNANYDLLFTPDAAGNRINMRGVTFSFNPNNQIANAGYVYDGNGNATTYKGMSGYTYDMENRANGIAGYISAANYRGDGLRGWKQSSATGQRVYFLYDGEQILCELDQNGAANRLYLYGDYGLAQRYVITSPSLYYTYTFNPDGNLVQRHTAGSSLPISTTLYDAFGMLLKDQSATGAIYPNTDPMGFQAQSGLYTDLETRPTGADTGLSIVGGSYYDPFTGRFLNRGGAGVNEYVAGGWSGLDTLQTVLDAFGLIPGWGELADVASGILDLARGDLLGAGLSLGSLLPVGGQVAGEAKIARRLARSAQKAAERVGNVSAIRTAKQLSFDFGEAAPSSKTYITYVFKNAGEIVYVGKASGRGTPRTVLTRRVGRGHEHWHPGLGDTREVIAIQNSPKASEGAEDVWYHYYRLQGAKLRNKYIPLSDKSERITATRRKNTSLC